MGGSDCSVTCNQDVCLFSAIMPPAQMLGQLLSTSPWSLVESGKNTPTNCCKRLIFLDGSCLTPTSHTFFQGHQRNPFRGEPPDSPRGHRGYSNFRNVYKLQYMPVSSQSVILLTRGSETGFNTALGQLHRSGRTRDWGSMLISKGKLIAEE